MIKNMKKILSILGLLSLCLAAFGQANPSPVTKWLPLAGYNVAIPTNQGDIGLLSTNIEYTTSSGKIVYSYQNTGITNGQSDAFRNVILQSDANGDVNANATLVISYGNTNLIPITNTSGFVTNWALADPTLGSQVIGTANVYPLQNANSTNFVTVRLFRSYWDNPRGDDTTYPAYRQYEPVSTFNVTFSQAATGGFISTNLPTVFLQGVRNVSATIQATNAAGNGAATLINFIGISQPKL